MRYVVDVGGTRVTVDVEGDSVRIDGVVVEARIADLPGTPVRLLTLGGAVHRVLAERGATRGAYVLSLDGHRYRAEALDERTRTIRDLTVARAPTGPAPLVAPMPGLVVRVAVAVGDEIQAGQGLVVVEAMKMENELRAPAAGRVKAVHAEPGKPVVKGTVLVELD